MPVFAGSRCLSVVSFRSKFAVYTASSAASRAGCINQGNQSQAQYLIGTSVLLSLSFLIELEKVFQLPTIAASDLLRFATIAIPSQEPVITSDKASDNQAITQAKKRAVIAQALKMLGNVSNC